MVIFFNNFTIFNCLLKEMHEMLGSLVETMQSQNNPVNKNMVSDSLSNVFTVSCAVSSAITAAFNIISSNNSSKQTND